MTSLPTPESLLKIAQTQLTSGRTEDAQKTYRQASLLCKNGPTLLEIGHALHASGDVSGAIASYRRASAVDRTLSEAYERVGALQLEMGGAQAACSFLESAIAHHPEVAILRIRLAEALEALDRPEDAHSEALKAQSITADVAGLEKLLLRTAPNTDPVEEGPAAAAPVASKRAISQLEPVEWDEIETASQVAREFEGKPTRDISLGIPEADATSSSSAMTSDLNEFQLPELLQLLVSRRATGRMEVYSQNESGTIGLVDGSIVTAQYSGSVHLCTYLIEKHSIAPDDLRNTPLSSDASVATSLHSNEILPKQQIQTILKSRITESLKAMMTWTEGYSSFVRTTKEDLGDTFDIAIDTQWAVFEVFRQLDEEQAANP